MAGRWSSNLILFSFSPNQRLLLKLLFDAPYYKAQASIDFDNIDELLEHYLRIGWRNGFDPSTTFRTARYLNATSGLRDTDKNPFAHYLFETAGEAALDEAFAGFSRVDIDKLRAHFDANFYLHSNPDIEMRGDDPFIHYMVSGCRELRDPSRRFSTRSYLDRYPDIRECGMNPFQHWVFDGIAEGRSGADATLPPLSSWESLSDDQRSILVNMFSIDYYQSHVATSDLGRGLPMAVQASSGWKSGGDATPSFRASRYVATHPELLDTEQVPFLNFLFSVVGESALRHLFVAHSLTEVQTLCDHFDTAWYLYSYPDVEASGLDAFIHYMVLGWLDGRDPSPQFATSAYLVRYPDIAECGMNPFLHWVLFGKSEGRSGASSTSNFRNRPYTPSITAILINSQVAPLSPDCLTAVLQQSYDTLAVLVIGAALSDGCRTILDVYERSERHKSVSYLSHDGPFLEWRLLEFAVEQAAGDLLWFVRGRGVHDVDFLARLTSSFADGSVQLGFGRRLEHDDDDVIGENRFLLQMDGWKRHSTSPAPIWFSDHLKPDELAADQDSFLWRRRKLSEDVWRQACDYHYLGIWHLFLHMAAGGQIASVRDALVRIPFGAGTSPSPFGDVRFYDDAARLVAEIRSFWPFPGVALDACGEALSHAYVLNIGTPPAAPITVFQDHDSLSEIGRIKRHVLIVTHGIFAGGAENFPIQLANELVERDITVSMLIFKTDDVNVEMRATLNPGVSIYEANWVLEYGCEKFVRDIGCSLIHSHGVVGEMFFFGRCDCTLHIPYVATLHGSYESSTSRDLPESEIAKIVPQVDLFIYTADKNLKPLIRHGVRPEQLVKMANAMPIDEAPFPQTRKDLGIAEDAIVFTLVARGIKEKGWSNAIRSFNAMQKRCPRRTMHLCLVGEGDEPERLKPLYADDTSISFLGFQLRIHGLYRMTDVAIVPTRFAGESYPLCIIQALQAAVPVIATDVGEIASMLQNDGVTGGIVVKSSRIDKQFEMRFADAMHDLVDDERRRQLSLGAGVLGRDYDMSGLTEQYVALYDDVLRRFAAAAATRSVGTPRPGIGAAA